MAVVRERTYFDCDTDSEEGGVTVETLGPDSNHGNHQLWYCEQTPMNQRLKELVLKIGLITYAQDI